MCYDGYAAVPKLGKICSVLDDNFDTLNLDTWQREVRLDGYDNGEFQWTTDSDNNSFVEDGILYLTPTLTSDHLGEDAEYGAAAPGEEGENLGDVGEYAALPVGLVGEYCGLAGLYAGDVGEAGERLSLPAPN